MKEQAVVRLLQHYQHDVKNELQVILGYLSMGNLDRVKDKVDQWNDHLQNEQKLLMLDAPQFTLWVISFNHVYDHFRLTYDIQTTKTLQVIDYSLADTCQRMIQCLLNLYPPKDRVHELSLTLSECTDDKIELTIRLTCNFVHDKAILKRELSSISNITVEWVDHENLLCQFSYTVK